VYGSALIDYNFSVIGYRDCLIVRLYSEAAIQQM